jgi:GDPmannose 4,6-dehydratase
MGKVIITGILGQDGASMSEYLLSHTLNEVYGMMRRTATPNYVNIRKIKDDPRFHIVDGDLSDSVSIENLIKKIKPDCVINFGANSFVPASWEMPLQVFDVNTLGVIRCLEAIRTHKRDCRFYQASSSEEFGNVDYCPQDIKHPFKPRSPYGASKCASRHIVKVYRESYNIFAVCGILFNHEGIHRSQEFVTRKISSNVARINRELINNLPVTPFKIGNVNTKRDWSDAEDFMDGVWKIVNQDFYNPNFKEIKEYILASGETHSVREFIELAFECIGETGEWAFEDPSDPTSEKYIVRNKVVVEIDKAFYRPAEVDILLGDSTPARIELGWKPKTSFQDLVKKMVLHDIKQISNE